MNTDVYTNHDDGSVHCLGNGKMAVYEQGADIIQVFGPPYSSPSFMKLLVWNSRKEDTNNSKNSDRKDDNFVVVSERKPGTAIWTHNIYEGKRKVGEIIDFVCSHTACFIREVRSDIQLKFKVQVESFVKTIDNTQRYNTLNVNKAILAACEPGAYIYAKYPMPLHSYYQLLIRGECKYETEDNGEFILCNKGKSTFYIMGGQSYKECITNTAEILNKNRLEVFNETQDWWHRFAQRRKEFAFADLRLLVVPEETALQSDMLDKVELPELKDVIDSISVVIKSQQGLEGGVLAGHFYHLGYVRDQYGVSRCLLKLGYYEEARIMLDSYFRIWKKYGRIHNAHGIGVDNVFHVHENDNVEITGYLIIQAFDYIRESRCEEYITEIFPMLEWAWEAQKKHLVKGMLPFNGDETYVAGGILPRDTLNDGSAEATLLFIEGGKRLLNWIEENGKWDKTKLDENKRLLAQTIGSYRSNFFKDGILITNNPDRKTGIALPLFRHGVCEGCGTFGWTEKNKNDRYVCPDCYSHNELKEIESKVFRLKSVSLLPLYIGSDMFSKEEIYKIVDEVINSFKKTGKLPSSPEGDIAVGYDYGFLLYNLVKLKHPYAFKIYVVMMAALDSTCAWVEYYRNGVPAGNRYRPWESGINIESAILFLEEFC